MLYWFKALIFQIVRKYSGLIALNIERGLTSISNLCVYQMLFHDRHLRRSVRVEELDVRRYMLAKQLLDLSLHTCSMTRLSNNSFKFGSGGLQLGRFLLRSGDLVLAVTR